MAPKRKGGARETQSSKKKAPRATRTTDKRAECDPPQQSGLATALANAFEKDDTLRSELQKALFPNKNSMHEQGNPKSVDSAPSHSGSVLEDPQDSYNVRFLVVF